MPLRLVSFSFCYMPPPKFYNMIKTKRIIKGIFTSYHFHYSLFFFWFLPLFCRRRWIFQEGFWAFSWAMHIVLLFFCYVVTLHANPMPFMWTIFFKHSCGIFSPFVLETFLETGFPSWFTEHFFSCQAVQLFCMSKFEPLFCSHYLKFFCQPVSIFGTFILYTM